VAREVGKSVTFRAALAALVLVGVPLVTATRNALASGIPPIASPCGVMDGQAPARIHEIGNSQNGTTICATQGEKLVVSLSAPAGAGMEWQRIVASPSGVLVPLPTPVSTDRVVTSTIFQAKRQGTVRLSSQRRGCPLAVAGSASCEVLVLWQATVRVHGLGRALPQPHPLVPQATSAAA
jgi:hypothetical protein